MSSSDGISRVWKQSQEVRGMREDGCMFLSCHVRVSE